jgi:hypothetical protein
MMLLGRYNDAAMHTECRENARRVGWEHTHALIGCLLSWLSMQGPSSGCPPTSSPQPSSPRVQLSWAHSSSLSSKLRQQKGRC